MQQLNHLSAALRSATSSLRKIPAGRVARVVIGVAVVLGAYVTLAGLKPAASHRGATVRTRSEAPAFLGLQAPVLPGLTSLLALPGVDAASCSDATISGLYSGYTFGSAGGSSINGLNYLNFNGSGSITSGGYWEMLAGSFSTDYPGYFTGTYSVNSNCTVTISTSTGGTFTGQVVSDGVEIDGSATNSGDSFVLVLKQVGTSSYVTSCGNSPNDNLLSGEYAGYAFGSDNSASAYNVAYYNFNGSGSITSGGYYGEGGSGTFTGSYSIGSGCIANFSLSTGGTLTGMMVSNGNEIDLLDTNTGAQFTEILKPVS